MKWLKKEVPMKNNFKIVFACLLFVFFASFGFAFDFGVALDSSFLIYDTENFQTDETTMEISEGVTLWAREKISKNISFYTKGNYQFSYDFEDFSQKIDLSNFQVQMVFPKSDTTKIALDLGRFPVFDAGRMIYNNPIDGGKIALEISQLDLELFCGYTGLLNGKSINISDSTVITDNEKVYALASGFVAAGFSTTAKNFFKNNSINFDISTFVPTSADEDRKTALYSEIGINGALSSMIYHDLYAGVSLFFTEEPKAGVFFDGTLSCYPGFLSSCIATEITFVTDTYFPFVDNSCVLGESESLNGLFKWGLTGSIKPVSTLLLAVGGDFVMDVEGSSFAKDCIQWNSSLKWQILSDVQFDMYIAQKIPLTDVVKPLFLGSASLVINF